jgi:hypothetical protein
LGVRAEAAKHPKESFLVRINQAQEVESMVFESASQHLLEAHMHLRLGGEHNFYDPLDEGMEFHW